MNITTEHANGIAVVRVGESRLMYPLLSEFSSAVQKLIASGERRVVSARPALFRITQPNSARRDWVVARTGVFRGLRFGE